ncbi:MAG TPA: helicase associated domain-containing protein [Prosthecobacter sp.]|nr:helicase associated domain-containing protein [Prosthecobacter sp.]
MSTSDTLRDDTNRWEQYFAKLEAFKTRHGHTRAHRRNHSSSLEKWCTKQRELEREGGLAPGRRERLEALGFEWESPRLSNFLSPEESAAWWDKRLAELEKFREQHGHVLVSKHDKTWHGLGKWLQRRRAEWRAGMLQPEQIRSLEALGVVSAVTVGRLPNAEAEARWERRFAELLAFREQHGHCDVPACWRENPVLADWVRTLRKSHQKGSLRSTVRQRLEAVGFTWQSGMRHLSAGWERRFAELKAFRQAHGHLHVSKGNQSTKLLGYWLTDQRVLMRNGILAPERVTRLDELDPTWRGNGTGGARPSVTQTEVVPKDALSQWEYYFARLLAFREQLGHTDVPTPFPEDRALSAWVGEQRTGHLYGRLHFDQITRLEKLGFAWTAPGE